MAEGMVEPGKNRLLLTLDPDIYQSVEPHLEPVELGLKTYVYKSGQPIEYAYFPINGVISMLAEMQDEKPVEVATVGNEGVAGLSLFLGAETTPGSCFSQVPGAALRMKAEKFKELARTQERFRTMLHRYTQALMVQISQGNGCNRIHSIEQRCARWLLLTHDRVMVDEFLLTQEFLGQMLGVRRASVNLVATAFQKEGYIQYVRGRIRILNRQGIESACCYCYTVIRREYDRLLGSEPIPAEQSMSTNE